MLQWRIDLLNKIDFVWSVRKKTNGDSYEDDPSWIRTQLNITHVSHSTEAIGVEKSLYSL